MLGFRVSEYGIRHCSLTASTDGIGGIRHLGDDGFQPDYGDPAWPFVTHCLQRGV
jgi:hypothetical protein